MSAQILGPQFYARPVVSVAKELLGKYLVVKVGKKYESYRILDVEAYEGEHDLASHARFGMTTRSSTLFGPPGTWYVYLIYGMYWMLNIVCEEEGTPGAVLLREIEGISGPGKITKTLQIDRRYNDLPANGHTGMWIEDRGEKIPKTKIAALPRVNVGYAGPIWANKRYRFRIGEN